MSGSHNNQLNMVSLFDEEPATPTHKPPRKRNRNMPAPMCHSKNLLEHDGPIDTYRGPEVDNSYINYGYQRDLHQRGEYHAMHGWPAPAPAVQGGNKSPSAGQDPLTPSRPSRPSLIVKLKIPVSSKVVAMHAPKFNKAGADCVRKESKEKDAVLNQLQDQKPAVVDDEVFEIQIDGPKTKDGLYGFKVEGLPVNHPLPNGIASEGIRAIDVVQGPLSQLDRTAGHGRDLVEQAVASAYNHSHESPFAYDEDLNDFQAYDFCGNGSQDSLLPSSSSGGPSSCGFLPEMSSPLGHAYKSPYSLLPGDDASRPPQPAASSLPQEQELAQPLPLYSSGQGAKCLDVGHFPDMFPHDVFSNCGFAQGSFADVYKTKAPEGYGFNAGHYT